MQNNCMNICTQFAGQAKRVYLGWLAGVALACGMAVSAPALAGDEGVTPTEIRIGASAVLTGSLGPQTTEYTVGSRLYFDAVNAAGGVHGRRIVYSTMDDAFDVKRAVENTRKLIEEDKVFLIYNTTGTAHTAAILPLAERSRTVVFGPVTGASSLRDTVHRYLFHVRASYANEARKIVSQVKRVGITRMGAFYQDDAFGKALLEEVRRAAQEEGMTITGEFAVDPKNPDFNAVAAATAQASPQAVVLCTAGTMFTSYIKAVQQGTPLRPRYYGFSVASLDVINRELGPLGRGIVLAQIMPSLKNTAVPVVLEYRKLLAAKDPDAAPSASQFEGFVHAKVLVDALRAAGRNLTTDSFIRGLESIGEIAYGPFKARYSPTDHNGSSYVELAIVDVHGQLRF